MTTPWTSPTTFRQYAESDAEAVHIPWFDQDNFSNLLNLNGRLVCTTAPLMHIARQPRNDITMKTYYLQCTGYNFQNLPLTISNISIKLTMNRSGRIADDTIQLVYQGAIIGKNLALPARTKNSQSSTLDPITIYGGPISNFEFTNDINLSMIQDPTFGVLLRFQSHPMWPHKTAPGVDCVELQIS
jgi:hypothetical protein